MQSSTSDSNDTALEIENSREEAINEPNSDKLESSSPKAKVRDFYLFSFYF